MNNANVEFNAKLIWKDREERGNASKSAIEEII